MIACRHDQAAVIEILLDRGNFNLSDNRAFIAACASGNILTLYNLMQSELQSSLGFVNSVGLRALYQAASNGHKSVVEALLAIKADPSIGDTATEMTPLQIATKNGHSGVVRAFFTLLSGLCMDMDDSHEISGM